MYCLSVLYGAPLANELVLKGRAAERIQGPRAKRGRRDPLQAMRVENLQGLKLNFAKSLLVYFLRRLGPCNIGCYEALWTLRPWGDLSPLPHLWVALLKGDAPDKIEVKCMKCNEINLATIHLQFQLYRVVTKSGNSGTVREFIINQ